MKCPLFFLLLLFPLSPLLAQTYTEGYYIRPAGDTVHTQIKIPRLLFGNVNNQGLQYKVKVLDSTWNAELKLYPADIVGYGFSYEGTERHFVQRKLPYKPLLFLERVATGQKVSCFYYAQQRKKQMVRLVVFERPDRQSAVFPFPMRKKKFKKTLKQLFSDNEGIGALIDEFDFRNSHIKSSVIELAGIINAG